MEKKNICPRLLDTNVKKNHLVLRVFLKYNFLKDILHGSDYRGQESRRDGTGNKGKDA
jgi:hypothetical protein